MQFISQNVSYQDTQIFVPGKPVVRLQISRQESRALLFKWEVTSKGRNDITSLIIRYKAHDTKWFEKRISPKKFEFELDNLQPFTEYTVRLTATTKFFKSDYHELKASTTEGSKLTWLLNCSVQSFTNFTQPSQIIFKSSSNPISHIWLSQTCTTTNKILDLPQMYCM